MFDYLIDHAIKNVWCSPEQDNQHIIAPYRISPSRGVTNQCQVMMRKINLPSKEHTYHVFQIGQLHPLLLGLFSIKPDWIQERWTSISESLIKECMIADVYTDLGIQIPRFETFYMFTNDRDLVIAVKENNKIPVDYQTEQIYIRVYSNAYFNSIRSDVTADTVFTTGRRIQTTTEILDLQILTNSFAAKVGLTNVFVNGYLRDKLDVSTVTIGDTVEIVYDSSVIRTVSFTIEALSTFESVLDLKRKYLLHYPFETNDVIDYHDDIDIFILDQFSGTRFNGVYYHRNVADACRMVTHRDYSIPVPYFVHLTQKLVENAGSRVLDLRKLIVRLNIRKSGYHRPLVFEHNRLHELYKLDDASIQQALLGINSTVPNWRAEHLEASFYTKIMRSTSGEITRELVQQAYGYNGVSKIVGDTPSITYPYSGRQQIAVPYGLQSNSTAYEYSNDGKLIGYYPHSQGSLCNAVNNDTAMIELISGSGDHSPDVRFGLDNIPLPESASYRVYLCHRTDIGYDEIWSDITGTELYQVVNNVLRWTNLDINHFLMVRTDLKFLAYDLNLRPIDGNIRFTLSEMEDRGNGPTHYTLPVPLGELDLFLNERPIIEGLDYHVEFPEIVITNKEYLSDNPNSTFQRVHIRFTGFCNADLKRDPIDDVGFIEHGVLSNNNRFDIRDDKVLRIVSDGRVYHRDSLIYSELHSGVSILNAKNGNPYSIRDIVVPLKNLVNENTYTFRKKSIDVDKLVSDYMTIKLPQPARDAVSAIERRYEVFSPFVCKIIYDMMTQHLPKSTFEKNLSDNDVVEICKPYEEWLRFDPCTESNKTDHRYVIIHPHNHHGVVLLNLFQYRFMRRVVALYCNGLVELSPFVALEPIQ